MAFDLSDTRCVRCGVAGLAHEAEFDPEKIVPRAVVCAGCGAGYAAIWGAPFIGAYQAEDIVGLIEIATNAAEPRPPVCGDYIREMYRQMQIFHGAADRDELIRTSENELFRQSWFGVRYSEWLQLKTLLEGIDLEGRRVLDVGAGIGTDLILLAQTGALVTAVEYNPFLVKLGRQALPSARWLGGQSHCLPFASQSFDVVTCNAALHHMRDVPAALREMLRVLKPGDGC